MTLFMCMGFGCNAVGVVGCRIIDSKRERLLAMLTNGFIPCNGRLPTLTALMSIFFVTAEGTGGRLLSAVLLTLLIFVSIFVTLVVSRLLSITLLRGEPSSFTLELPPYRTPNVGRVILRSVLDRTLLVLGRAVVVAAPAGLLLWILANVQVGQGSLLRAAAELLTPLGTLLGMDGVILLSFLLALPANEILLPVMLMAYTGGRELIGYTALSELKTILTLNGWTALTALCVMIFVLFHFPCSSTLMTVKKESGSWRWTAVAALLPTAVGALLCVGITLFAKIFVGYT